MLEPMALVAVAALLFSVGFLLGRKDPNPLATFRKQRSERPARVTVEGVRLTAGGAMLIVRYRVLRPGKLDVGPDRFGVIDEETGERMSVLNVARPGSVSVTEGARDASGYLLVSNRNDAVKPGSRLRVLLGGGTWEHVEVASLNAGPSLASDPSR